MRGKRCVLILIALSLFFQSLIVISSTVSSATETIYNEDKAVALNKMGLLMGSNGNFDLDKRPTRAEGAVMFVKLLGKEAEAKASAYEHPFTDVPSWADPFVGYMYHYKYTAGIGNNLYGTTNLITAQEYLTFLLKALGYTNQDFKVENALVFAWDMGLIGEDTYNKLKNKTFLRDDIAELSYNALSCVMKGSTKRLINMLIENGAVDEDKAREAGINTSDSFYSFIDCGTVDGIQFFEPADITKDIRERTYTNGAKSIGIKIDRASLPDGMRNFTKTGRTEVHGTVNADSVRNAVNEIKARDYISPYQNGTNSDGYLERFVGFSNDMVLVLFDNGNNPLGYTVIHFLGFNDPPELQYLDDHFEKIDLGTVGGVVFTDAITLVRTGFEGYLPRVNRDLLPDSAKDFKKIGTSGFYCPAEELYKKEYMSQYITPVSSGGASDYNDDMYKASWSGAYNQALVILYDGAGKPLAYCIFRKK